MDEERLIVALEARIRDFERNLQRASKTAGSNFDAIERRAKQSGDKLESLMASASSRMANSFRNFGAGMAGGIAGALTIEGFKQLASYAGRVTEEVANIGSAAKRAGLDAQSFQQLAFVAKANRIEVDALTDGMKELQLRADEFIVTGSGSGAEAFMRLGLSASQLKERLHDPAELFLLIIGRLQQLDRQAQIRVADEIFGGTGGERFVELIGKGEAGIRQTMAAAQDLGAVMSDEVIQRADELNGRFTTFADTLETRVHSGMILLLSEMADFIDKMGALEGQRDGSILLCRPLIKDGRCTGWYMERMK